MRGEAEIRSDAMMWSLVAEIWGVVAEIEGMKAANQERRTTGEQGRADAYGEEDFAMAQEKLQGITAALRSMAGP